MALPFVLTDFPLVSIIPRMRTQFSTAFADRSPSWAERLLVRSGFIAAWGVTAFVLTASGCGRSPGPAIASVESLSAADPISTVMIPQQGSDAPSITPLENVATPAKADGMNAAPVVETDPASAPIPFTFDVQRLVGSWRDSFCGQRTLTLNADGTATMRLELDFAGRLLYGKRLTFDMRWTVNESILTFEILTGSPLDAARSAMKVWGEKFEYRVVQLDDEQLQAWTSDDSTLYKLRRETDDNSDAR